MVYKCNEIVNFSAATLKFEMDLSNVQGFNLLNGTLQYSTDTGQMSHNVVELALFIGRMFYGNSNKNNKYHLTSLIGNILAQLIMVVNLASIICYINRFIFENVNSSV